MSRRLLASLVLCAALLTQAIAPAWRGGALSASAASANETAFCHLLDRDGGAAVVSQSDASGRSKQAPIDHSRGHDHHSCSLCQLGASASIDAPTTAASVTVFASWSQAAFIAPSDLVVSAPTRHVAPARAPPSQA